MSEFNSDEEDTNFNVYVGGANGVLKGIYFGEKKTPVLKSFQTFDNLEPESNEITCLNWVQDYHPPDDLDDSVVELPPEDYQKKILVAFKNKNVSTYNTKIKCFTGNISLDYEDGKIIGIHNFEGNILYGTDAGNLGLWTYSDFKTVLQIKTGNHLSKILQCPVEKNLVITGGKENDLKLWDLKAEDTKIPIFKAKNVPHDNLDLRVPVYIQDLTFLPHSNNLIATCSRHSHVRLYDTKVTDNKNRPVINIKFLDHSLMAISATRNIRQVIVGSGQGKMGLIDLRNPKTSVVRQYTGFTGSIRSISAHPELPYFVSGGLDRHLLLHNLNEKQPIKKLYLRSKLNAVLMSDTFFSKTAKLDDSTASWQNISMEILDTKERNTDEIAPPAKKKKSFFRHTESVRKKLRVSISSEFICLDTN